MSKLLLLLVVGCVAAVWAAPKTLYNLQLADQLFEEFTTKYQRQYQTEGERQKRFEIFKENLKHINERNMRSKTATFGINKFGDMTKEEFRAKLTCLSQSLGDGDCPAAKVSGGPAPAAFDWRDHGKVTKVKVQGSCQSCWAFSTTGNLEGQYAIKYNKSIELSEQQLVDCDRSDQGCFGGLMTNAFIWIMNRGGIMSEQSYPYTAKDGKCKFNKDSAVATVSGCHSFGGVSEEDLKQVLVSTGPLAISVDASDFVRYTGGILHDCEAGQLNHGVLLVGYGKENNTPFWIIKNSWGEDWGEKGYVRLKMYENACAMTEDISSAIVN